MKCVVSGAIHTFCMYIDGSVADRHCSSTYLIVHQLDQLDYLLSVDIQSSSVDSFLNKWPRSTPFAVRF